MRRRAWSADPEAVAAGTRKQATVPVGAYVLKPVRSSPGLVVLPAEGRGGPPVVVLPGPPAELRAMWRTALSVPAVRAAISRATPLLQEVIRMWGTLEVTYGCEAIASRPWPSRLRENPFRNKPLPRAITDAVPVRNPTTWPAPLHRWTVIC
jgi:hypothetical protein